MQKFEGLIAAPFTPMKENGEVNYDRIRVYYDFLKKNKMAGAFINGSTGEGVSLTQKERKKIAEQWVAASKANPGVKIINLVGGTSYVECIEEAKYSSETGADAIAASLYYKLIEAFDSGDLETARQLQQKAIDMIRLLEKYGGIATGKAFMRYVGFDCGEFRSPIKNISEEEYKNFVEDVHALDMNGLFSVK